MKRFCDLNEQEFDTLEKEYYSVFPLVYYKVRHYKNIDFNFSNPYIKRLFNYLFKANNLEELCNIFIEHAYKIIVETYANKLGGLHLTSKHKSYEYFKNHYNLDYIIEFAKTFFAFDYSSRNLNVFKIRQNLMEKTFKLNELRMRSIKVSSEHWRHDGFWNNYYGPLIDDQARRKLENKVKNIRLSEYECVEEYCCTFLTLAYRYAEIKQIKKARKIIRKLKRFLRFKVALIQRKQYLPIYDRFGLFSFFKAIQVSYGFYIRFYLNSIIFLYRTAKTNFNKKRLLNKLLRKQSLRRLFHKEYKSISKYGTTAVISATRPQHLIKLIEIRVDALASFYSNKKRKEVLLNEIKFLLIEVMKQLKYKYYGSIHDFTTGYYFIIIELYLEIFYILEKIYEIDIRQF